MEPLFSSLWKRYNYCLKQRNALLKKTVKDDIQLDIWEQSLGEQSIQITQLRKHYFNQFEEKFKQVLSEFDEGTLKDIQLSFRQGWDKSLNYREALKQNRDKDFDRGHTSVGPHRMDVRIRNGALPAIETLSRGQQKILIVAMYIAQVAALQSLVSKPCLVLVDDLEAELDELNSRRVLEKLSAMRTQLVCTCLEPSNLLEYLGKEKEYSMFHVEHGKMIS